MLNGHPLPVLTKVKLEELRRHLPDDAAEVFAAERNAMPVRRRIGAQFRRRW